ncbi:MAG: phosphoglycolate phosphatase [Thermosphaera sp.]
MSRVRIVFIDVDGTITEGRDTYLLDLELVSVLRMLAGQGVYVSIVSSNALPVVIGLARYLGFNGPVTGESGSLVYYDKWGLVELAGSPTRHVYVDVLERFKDYVDDTWQNRFRIYEYALKVRKGFDGWMVYRMVADYVESNYRDVRVGYSGYAIHLMPRGVDKGVAVKYVLDRMGINPDEAAGVGDSVMDVEIMKHVGLRVAVGNADEELKKVCNIVLDKPSSKGVLDFARMIIQGAV